jgi:DNA-binding GntR family transcriptional regulator
MRRSADRRMRRSGILKGTMSTEPRRPSLVDGAEEALRNWLAPGRHRAGDRLPPEHEVAAMLGISRGTLRTALARLEDSGEIVRRQGSGTFVGRVAVPAALSERLERLEPYSSLARRRGVMLEAVQVRVEQRAVGREVGEALELPAEAQATSTSRLLLADGEPVAVMFDVVHPDVQLPDVAALRRTLERGGMVLDVLIELPLPIAFARTRVIPCLLSPRERAGKLLAVKRTTAVLELEEVIYVTGGQPVAYSRDLFAPDGVHVQVMRSLDPAGPGPIAPTTTSQRMRRRRRAAGAGR